MKELEELSVQQSSVVRSDLQLEMVQGLLVSGEKKSVSEIHFPKCKHEVKDTISAAIACLRGRSLLSFTFVASILASFQI